MHVLVNYVRTSSVVELSLQRSSKPRERTRYRRSFDPVGSPSSPEIVIWRCFESAEIATDGDEMPERREGLNRCKL